MAKRLSEKQKEEIIKLFIDGKKIEDLAIEFKCTKLTISRNLKKNISEKKYKVLINKSKSLSLNSKNKELKTSSIHEANFKKDIDYEIFDQDLNIDQNNKEEISFATPFIEITPLDYKIDYDSPKDLSSISISEIDFPKIVYMIVDKKIELEVKYLKDYPNWEFLSKDELNRKTIEIYLDLKNAKRHCNKEQKVIKVPNSDVFKLVAPMLLSRGISRIISEDNLIAL